MISGGINAVKFFFLFLLLVACAIAVYFSTDMGKERLIKTALSYVNNQSYKIKIHDIESYFPLTIHFRQIEILDRNEPQLYLRDVTLKADTSTLLLEKRLEGELNIEECILFDTPPDQDDTFVPLKLGLGLDLKITCGSTLIEERGPNYFITASLPKSRIQYDSERDVLNYAGQIDVDLSGQSLSLEIAGQGSINDFDLTYNLKGDHFKNVETSISKLSGTGSIARLPWKGEGPINIDFLHNNVNSALRANLRQNRYLVDLNDINLQVKGLKVLGSLNYNSRTIHVKGGLKADLDNVKAIGNLPLAGKMILDSQFDLHGNELHIKLDAKGKNLSTNDMSMQDMDCQISAQHVLQQPEGTIALKASNVSGSFGKIQSTNCVGTFKNGVGDVKLQMKGDRTSGNVSLDINYNQTKKDFKVKTFEGKFDSIPILLRQPFDLSMKENNIEITPVNLVIMNSPLRIEGAMKSNQLNFKASGEIDILTFSRLILDEDDITKGKMKINMNVSGPMDKIRLEGSAEINGGTYEKVHYGTAFKDINIKLAADKERVRIVSASAKDLKSGTVTATGDFNFTSQQFAVNLKGEQVHLLTSDQMSMVARTADVSLKGQPDKAVVTGEITVDEGSYSIAPQIKSTRLELNVKNPRIRKPLDLPEISQATSKSAGFNPGLDLVLKFPPVLKINGRGLTSTWKGKLELKGDFDLPRIFGKLSVDVGQMNFLGQTVELTKGSIKFDGSGDNIPYIDTTGILKKQDIEVTIGIVGRVNKPNIDLQSQPALPKDEILSILFFGKDKSKLSPIEAVQLARALAAYKGIGADLDFFTLITDNLGLDQLSFGAGPTEGTYSLKVSKRLGDQIRVNLNQGMKPEDSNVELEVEVNKNISVKAEHGFAGSSDGVSVNYNWDY